MNRGDWWAYDVRLVLAALIRGEIDMSMAQRSLERLVTIAETEHRV